MRLQDLPVSYTTDIASDSTKVNELLHKIEGEEGPIYSLSRSSTSSPNSSYTELSKFVTARVVLSGNVTNELDFELLYD